MIDILNLQGHDVACVQVRGSKNSSCNRWDRLDQFTKTLICWVRVYQKSLIPTYPIGNSSQ
jgi:hypothetical protein